MTGYFRQYFRTILIILGLIAVLWLLFAPVQLGGTTAYVIITGNSMEPIYSEGDLVFARKAAQYSLDQLVVYQHPQIGYVFHRIVDQTPDGFILKGDNNTWLDSFHPKDENIIGRYWFVLPGGGSFIRTLREPLYFTVFGLIIFGVIFSLFWFQKNDSKKSKVRKTGKNMDNQTKVSSGDTRQELLLFIGLLALAALIFGGIAFFKPVTRLIADDLSYVHQGTFEYSARDRANIYDSDIIVTGEPVYLLLTCDMTMNFSYQFAAPRMKALEQTRLQGTYLINVQVSDVDGWKRSFQLIPETEFQGSAFDAQMDFDLCQAQAIIQEKEEKTETKNRGYSLLILPEITLSGSIEKQPLDTTYLPRIEFLIDSTIVRLPEGLEGLALDQEGSLENLRVVSNTMRLFGQEINILLARRIALIALGFCLAAAVLPAWSLYQDWKKSDISRIQIQYYPMLVDVQAGSPVFQAEQVVEVVSFSDLTKMAERYGAMILHEARGSFHRYSVQDEQTVYQYTLDIFKEQTLFPNITKFKRSLLSALEADQLELSYQPVFRVKENTLAAFEAFIRWNHPDYGILYPADFISHAEECQLLPDIDRWVSRKVCQQLHEWTGQGLAVLPVSINLAPDTILDSAFVSRLSDMVAEELCDPKTLQIEINRSNQVFHSEAALEHLTQISALGIRIAIDNFASDSANQINQILRLPIKTLKIDRTVLQGISENEKNQRLLIAVASMAKSLQIEVVAQGVESQVQLDYVMEHDIDLAQGFFLGKPVQAGDLIPLLKKPAKKKTPKSKK